MLNRLGRLGSWVSRRKAIFFLFLLLALSSVWLATHVETLGEGLSYSLKNTEVDVKLDYAFGLLWWGILALGLWLFGGSQRNLLVTGWAVKFFIVLVLMLFYEFNYRYNLDAFEYFRTVVTGEHSMYDGVDWRKESWIPTLRKTVEVDELEVSLVQTAGTENMVRVVMALSQVTGPYYHALKVVFAFFGFLGVWMFYQVVVVLCGRPLPGAFYVFLLYPSILFWSSILGKDSLMLFVIGVYAYGATRWLGRGSRVGLAWAGLGVLLTFLIRPWMAAIEAVSLAFATLVRWFGVGPVLVACAVGIPGMLLYPDVSELVKALEAGAFIEELATRAGGVAQETGSGAGLGVEEAQALMSSPSGLLVVMFSGIFRPLPFDARSLLIAIAALENTILLVLVVRTMKYLRWSFLKNPVVLWALIYSVLWAGVYGLVVLANFGAGMRYKLQVLPFIVLLLFLLLRPEGRAALASRSQAKVQAT